MLLSFVLAKTLFSTHSKKIPKTSFVVAKPKIVDKTFALKKFIGPTFAIVGRPNVGKSSLFNRLAGREVAIVHRSSGITRDRKVGQGYLSDLRFVIIDTPGFEELTREERADLKSVRNSMVRQAELALKNAHAALFVVDACEGLSSDDLAFANWMRGVVKKHKQSGRDLQIALIANKSDGKDKNQFSSEAPMLRMGEPTYISAKHNEGMADLYNTIRATFVKLGFDGKRSLERTEPSLFAPDTFAEGVREKDPLLFKEEKGLLQFALIGRPNVGKSTLTNAILRNFQEKVPGELRKDDRVVTSPVPGTTRDSISTNLVYKDQLIKLVDTAGIVGPGRMSWRSLDRENSAAMDDTMRSMAFSNVVCLLVDVPENIDALLAKLYPIDPNDSNYNSKCEIVAKSIFKKKDLSISKKVLNEGRALFVALNKADKLKTPELTNLFRSKSPKETGSIRQNKHASSIDKKSDISKFIGKILEEHLHLKVSSSAGKVRVISLSAISEEKSNCALLMDTVLDSHFKWNSRVSTSKINKWLGKIFQFQPPPFKGGKAVKVRFVTQVKTRPPTFALFVNKKLPTNYEKFLSSKIREEFGLDGVPIRLLFRTSENPFVSPKKKVFSGETERKISIRKPSGKTKRLEHSRKIK